MVLRALVVFARNVDGYIDGSLGLINLVISSSFEWISICMLKMLKFVVHVKMNGVRF